MRSLHRDSLEAAHSASMVTLSDSDSDLGDGELPSATASMQEDGMAAAGAAGPVTLGRMAGISSYIVVTHQHSTIRRAVDRIIFLHEGRVVWEGSVAEFDTTEEPIVRQFVEGSLKGPISYV